MNVNKATIIGRLVRDPEVRTTPNGQSVTNISVATSTTWKDQSGAKQEKTEFHNVVAWGKRGEVIAQYFVKGQEIYVEGRLETRSWDDQESGKKMYRTEINLENFEFGAKPGGASGAPQGAPTSPASNAAPAAAAAPVAAAAATKEPELEQIPTINLEDEDEVKLEDVPF